MQTVLNLINSHLAILRAVSQVNGVLFRKFIRLPTSLSILNMAYLAISALHNSKLIIWSTLKWYFMKGASYCSNSILLQVGIQFCQNHLCNRLYSSICSVTLSKNRRPLLCQFTSVSSVMFHWTTPLDFHHCSHLCHHDSVVDCEVKYFDIFKNVLWLGLGRWLTYSFCWGSGFRSEHLQLTMTWSGACWLL